MLAAVNEERLSRRKLEVRFPRAAIGECLRLAGLGPREIQTVAASTSDLAKTLTRAVPALKERFYRLRRREVVASRWIESQRTLKYWLAERRGNRFTARCSAALLRRELGRLGLTAPLRLYDHHLAHAAAAAAWSGSRPATILTVDGVGDGWSSTVSRWREDRLERLAATPARDSVGVFYEHVTHLLGWRELEDEGKVMALAEHAAGPAPAHGLEGVLAADGLHVRATVHGPALRRRLRAGRDAMTREWFARLAQSALEEVLGAWARQAVAATGLPRLVLAGGVASNVAANRLLRLEPTVESVEVFPHMGDGGLALGAAVCAAWEAGLRPRLDASDAHLAWGPSFDERTIEAALDGLRAERPPRLVESVVDRLEADAVVLWFQGAMEYGPRALGQRSVVARPDREALRDRLNGVLKRREWFQPFCPSLLERAARAALADYAGEAAGTMTMAYSVRPEFRGRLAGVVAPGGSCRPQIVRDDEAGAWGDLLRATEARLGLAALLNTSFNLHGEPLVCAPSEAVDVWRRSGADCLVIGPYLVDRAPSPA